MAILSPSKYFLLTLYVLKPTTTQEEGTEMRAAKLLVNEYR